MSELKLTDRNWGRFTIGDLFHIKIGKSIDGNKVNRENGKIAYITRKEQNNGLDGFIDYESDFLNNDYPVLTIGNETAEPFVQCYPFFTGTKVNILKPRQELSASVLSFVAVSLKQHKSKYSYSFTINSTRLKKQVILLPVNSDGLPDWQFMEDFMKQIERNKIANMLSYYNNSLNNNSLRRGVERWMPSENRWAAFAIRDICEIVSGQDIYERERIAGNTPYITATANNNGIGYFISNQNTTLEKDCISVNRNGSVGYAFYHPYHALFGNDTRKLRPKYLNKYTSLFLTACIEKQRVKYGYGYKMGTERLKKQKILLPVNADNQPDWTNIERFMQRIELEKIVCYLKSKQQVQFPCKTV